MIGILECGRIPPDLAERHGDYPAQIARLLGEDVPTRTYHVVDGEVPAWDAADGWAITGSRHGAYDGHPWIPPLEAMLRDCEGRRPVVGICFGHQILAQAFGGTVVKHPGGWRLGPQPYRIEGQDLTLNAFHQDQVVALPDGATATGSAPGCEIAALRLGDWAVSVQPHPEFGTAFTHDLLAARAEILPPDRAAEARAAPPATGAAPIAAMFRRQLGL